MFNRVDKITANALSVDLRRRISEQGNINQTTFNELATTSIIEIPICFAATTGDILLDGSVTTLDGVSIVNALFVLVKNQTDKKENGIYTVDTNGWTRWQGLKPNMLVCILNGDTQENTIWQNINNEIEFSVTDIEFELLNHLLFLNKLADVETTGITDGQILKWVAANNRFEAADESGGGGGIADGTVNHSTLRWDTTASEWQENTKALLQKGASENNITILAPTSATNSLYWRVRNFDAYMQMIGSNSSDNRFVGIYTDAFSSYLALRQGTECELKLSGEKTLSGNAIYLATNSVIQFTVDFGGVIKSKHLQGTGNRPLYTDSAGRINAYSNSYGKLVVPVSAAEPLDTIIYETTETVTQGVYDVDVFIGILERDVSLNEVNVSLIQELEIWDESLTAYQRIGASHLLNYTTPGGADYKLINRTLQGSAIVTVPASPNNKFKIRVLLPNHSGGGTGQITGGYIHYRRID